MRRFAQKIKRHGEGRKENLQRFVFTLRPACLGAFSPPASLHDYFGGHVHVPRKLLLSTDSQVSILDGVLYSAEGIPTRVKQTVLEWKGTGSKLSYTKVVGVDDTGLAAFDDKLHMVCVPLLSVCPEITLPQSDVGDAPKSLIKIIVLNVRIHIYVIMGIFEIVGMIQCTMCTQHA